MNKPISNSKPEKTEHNVKQSDKSATCQKQDLIKGNKIFNWLAYLFLLILVGACFGYLFLEITHTQKALNNNIHSLKTQQEAYVQSHITTLQKDNNNLQENIQEVKSQNNSFSQRLQSLEGKSRAHWKLLEAEFLLHLVNQNLLINKDIRSSVKLLEQANELIRSLDDNIFYPIRSAITADMAILNKITVHDVEGIYLQINSLLALIPNLSPQHNSMTEPTSSTQTTNDIQPDTNSNTFQNYWLKTFMNITEGIWHNISTMFRFSLSHKDSVRPLLTQDNSSLIKLNLYLSLSQAQLALLTQQPEIYKSSLSNAQIWVTDYYFSENPTTKNFLSSLRDLLATQIITKLPVLTHGLDALKNHPYYDPPNESKGLTPPKSHHTTPDEIQLHLDTLPYPETENTPKEKE